MERGRERERKDSINPGFNVPTSSLFASWLLRDKSVRGGKMSKERLTVLLCGNMAGEMKTPLVIGKAAKPRCLKNLKINNLPVI
jgi:hypothetical protein